MITSSFGEIQIKGSVNIVLTDLSLIVRSINKFLIQNAGMDEEKAKYVIQHCCNIGFLSEEELDQENERIKQQQEALLKDAPNKLAELFEILAESLKGGASE